MSRQHEAVFALIADLRRPESAEALREVIGERHYAEVCLHPEPFVVVLSGCRGRAAIHVADETTLLGVRAFFVDLALTLGRIEPQLLRLDPATLVRLGDDFERYYAAASRSGTPRLRLVVDNTTTPTPSDGRDALEQGEAAGEPGSG